MGLCEQIEVMNRINFVVGFIIFSSDFFVGNVFSYIYIYIYNGWIEAGIRVERKGMGIGGLESLWYTISLHLPLGRASILCARHASWWLL